MPPKRSAEERFFEKTGGPGDLESCWKWVAVRDHRGYGRFVVKRGETIAAHRWAWEFFRGEIPEGLVLDHLCRNRGCVNPWHLDPVTHAVNSQRGRGGYNTPKSIMCRRKLHVMNESAHVRPDGSRYCKRCANKEEVAA